MVHTSGFSLQPKRRQEHQKVIVNALSVTLRVRRMNLHVLLLPFCRAEVQDPCGLRPPCTKQRTLHVQLRCGSRSWCVPLPCMPHLPGRTSPAFASFADLSVGWGSAPGRNLRQHRKGAVAPAQQMLTITTLMFYL